MAAAGSWALLALKLFGAASAIVLVFGLIVLTVFGSDPGDPYEPRS